MVPDGPNQLWVADITYVAIATGFVYLAAIFQCGGGREPDGTARQKPPSMISNLVVASVEELNQTQTMPERVSDHRNLAPCFSADCLLDRGARRLSARERDRGRRF